MELALNLVWLAISVTVFAFFGRYLVSESNNRKRVVACIALVCVVCLLFPAVSMTDDLNSSPAIPEATKLKKLLPTAHFVVFLFSHALVSAPGERVWATLAFEQENNPVQQVLLSFDLSRRPPPVPLHLI